MLPPREDHQSRRCRYSRLLSQPNAARQGPGRGARESLRQEFSRFALVTIADRHAIAVPSGLRAPGIVRFRSGDVVW
jgi:hypothetical protein